MRIPGLKTAKTFSRWLRARLHGGAMILGYHRIVEETHDDYEVCVSPGHFEEQMEAVSKHTRAVSLPMLVQHLKQGSLPARSVAVTFDDGYTDNLYHAKPILEKYEVPATVFICTGYMGKEFWWDELRRLVMTSSSDPCALRLEAGSSRFHWEPPASVHSASHPADASMRSKFSQALYQFLLLLDVDGQHRAMDGIRKWSGLSPTAPPSVRAMTEVELLTLANGGLVELGAHTRTHPMLPRLSQASQKDEIVSSKHDLEKILGRPVESFSYPNGRATADAKSIVQEAGFTSACTSLQDVIRSGCDVHELTRFWQKDVDGDKFLQGLSLWLRGAGARQ